YPSALHSFPTRRSSDLLPPGAYGQINVMVLDGYLSSAQLKPAAGTSRPAAVVLRKLRRCMVLSPGLVVPRECRHATCRSAVLGRSEEHTSELQSQSNLV